MEIPYDLRPTKTKIPPECVIETVVTGEEPVKRGLFSVFQGKWYGADVQIKCCHSTASADARLKFDIECLFARGNERRCHPHVVQCFGVCEMQSTRTRTTGNGIVSEYMHCTLKERLQDGQPQLTRLGQARVASGVASGLEYLHSKGLVYRNACTRGIMLTSPSATECTAKLSDLMLVCKETTHGRCNSTGSAQGLDARTANTRAQDLGARPKDRSMTAPAAAAPKAESDGGAGSILHYLELDYLLQAPEVREQIAEAKRCGGGGGGDDTAYGLAEASQDLHSLGVTLLVMCSRAGEPDRSRRWLDEALRGMADADTNVRHPLLETVRALVRAEPAMRESACAVGRRLSAVVDTLLQKPDLVVPDVHRQDQNQQRPPGREAGPRRSIVPQRSGDVARRPENVPGRQNAGESTTTTDDATTAERDGLRQELAMVSEQLAKVTLERDKEHERAKKLARENEDRKSWFKATSARIERQEAEHRRQEAEHRRQQAELVDLHRRQQEERDASRRATASNSLERRLLRRALQRVACRVGQDRAGQGRTGQDRAAACCLVLGLPVEGGGDISVAPQWAHRLNGRDLCFEEGIVDISRHPCVHDDRIYTALWKKQRGSYAVSFCSAALDDLNNWRQETPPFTLQRRSTPTSDPFDYASHAGNIFCISASEQKQAVCLTRWKPATMPGQLPGWEVMDIKQGSFRANYGIGLVGNELLLIGGTSGSDVQSAAELGVMVFNLQRPGGGGDAGVSRWPALPGGTGCTNPSVVVSGSHLHLLNAVRAAGKLQSTVLSLDLSGAGEERRWQHSNGFVDVAGCGVGVSGDYTLVAGGLQYQSRLLRFGPGLPQCLQDVKVRAAQEQLWLDLPDLNHARAGCSLLAVNGKLVCLGGRSQLTSGSGDDGTFVKQIEVLSWP